MVLKTDYMKTQIVFLITLFSMNHLFAQKNEWSAVEKVFGKPGEVQNDVFRIVFPRYDLQVKTGGFTIAQGLALGTWIGLMKMGDQTMMMGDLVLLDKEVAPVVSKLIAENLQVTALHNHLVGESPAIKYVHFEGSGEAVQLAEKIKYVITMTGTPMSPPPPSQRLNPDWSKVEAILGSDF